MSALFPGGSSSETPEVRSWLSSPWFRRPNRRRTGESTTRSSKKMCNLTLKDDFNRRKQKCARNVFVDGEDYNKKKRKSYADCEDPGARATLYAGGAFDGERLSLHSSAPRIGLFGFPSASVRVSGSCCWELFERVGFTGNMVRLCPGNYSESMLSGSISRGIKSVKAVRYHMV